MKRIDSITLVAFALVGWILLKDSSNPPSNGGVPGSAPETPESTQEKIKKDQQSVLNNLEGQLEKFAVDLDQDINGTTEVDPSTPGFPDGVPAEYAPQGTTPYSSMEKLRDDLNYRMRKFNQYASQAELELGADKGLVRKHNAQRAQILKRHRELIIEFEKENQESSSKRLR